MQEQADNPVVDSDFDSPQLEAEGFTQQEAIKGTQKLKNKVSGLMQRIGQKLSLLNSSQWIYLVAFVLLLDSAEGEGDFEFAENLIAVGIVAGIGLIRELWHLFYNIWQKTLGKGVVLVLYAATANFAVAVSALKINAIAGIEPTPFIFTLAFTTLLMLPFWLIVATIIFFSLAMVAISLWLLASVLLRLVRVKVRIHWEDQHFAFVTVLLRLILIPIVIATLVHLIEPYAEQIQVFEGQAPVEFIDPDSLTEDELARLNTVQGPQVRVVWNDILEERKRLEAEADAERAASQVNAQSQDVEQGGESADESNTAEETKTEEATRYLDTMVANFIYWFEAYPYSSCHKKPNQRSLIIDENSVLLAERDDSELGFKFSVEACIPRYQPRPAPTQQPAQQKE